MMTFSLISFSQHEYEEIVNWYKDLASQNPNIVKYVESIGKSVEGRDQPAVHITSSSSTNVKRIYFQCQIHASMCTIMIHAIEWLV